MKTLALSLHYLLGNAQEAGTLLARTLRLVTAYLAITDSFVALQEPFNSLVLLSSLTSRA